MGVPKRSLRRFTLASILRNYDRVLTHPRLSVRWSTTADADMILACSPSEIVLATGARPYEPELSLSGIEVIQAWDVLAGHAVRERVVVADWGRDSTGLDCAELLAERGHDVTLAIGSIYPGELLHQYHRNAYIGRLSRAGVRIDHYLGLEGADEGAIRFRNVCAPELKTTIPAETLVLCAGRVPNSDLGDDLRRRGARLREAGDCRSPRGLEEAILEGTLALHHDAAVE